MTRTIRVDDTVFAELKTVGYDDREITLKPSNISLGGAGQCKSSLQLIGLDTTFESQWGVSPTR
jgi:hypothetical protein